VERDVAHSDDRLSLAIVQLGSSTTPPSTVHAGSALFFQVTCFGSIAIGVVGLVNLRPPAPLPPLLENTRELAADGHYAIKIAVLSLFALAMTIVFGRPRGSSQ
jgi:hypothetical protein